MKKNIIYLSIMTLVCLSCSERTKTGFVYLKDVYEKFPLTKETQTRLEQMQNQRKAITDSMAWRLKNEAGNVSKDPLMAAAFEKERMQLTERKRFFDEDNDRAIQQGNTQIWKQINQYIKDYGEENKYDYIYGAEGNGTLMYADKKNDITNDVSQYVNKRYAGVKK